MATGLSEWSDKHPFRKLTFFISRLLWFIVGSFVVAGLFAFGATALAINQEWIHPKHEEMSIIAAYALGTLFMAAAFLKRIAKEIRESNDRVASTGLGLCIDEDTFSS